MAVDASTILGLVLTLMWTCFMTTPQHHKHPIFAKVLLSQDPLEELLSDASIMFAPGLYQVLQSATPPSVAFFKSLATKVKKRWGIYVLVLEKAGHRSKVYIGSGTNARLGVSDRFAQYDSLNATTMPRCVQRALNDDYLITRKGLLCWAPIPSAALVPVLRVLFTVLEATFTFVFWCIYSKTKDYGGMDKFCLWPLDTLEYDGLCSHDPLHESVAGNFSLSAEELEAQAAEFSRRRAEKEREREANRKAKDPIQYAAQRLQYSATYREKNPDKVKTSSKNSREKIKKQKTHYCAVCRISFDKVDALMKHLAGPVHAAKANNVYSMKTSPGRGAAVAKRRANNNKQKKHYCSICGFTFQTAFSLNRHLDGPKYAAKAAKAAKLSRPSSSQVSTTLKQTSPQKLNQSTPMGFTKISTTLTQSSTQSFTQSSFGGFL
jgi:hypothetical protein